MNNLDSLEQKIEALKFKQTDFSKFIDSIDPLYKDYGERSHEKWHDIGYNNAIDSVLRLINSHVQE